MNAFSISELEKFSGIKAHTIRIWEQRYQALKPHRSDGNTRSYDGSQLRRLLNIVSLLNSEYKVSELCTFPDTKLNALLQNRLKQLVAEEESNGYYISQLIAAGMSFDEPHFNKIFSHCLLKLGIRNTYLEVVYPMLLRLGLMWSVGDLSPAYEHFISNLLKQKLFTAIDALPPPSRSDRTWLLFLPENEFHEIGLLFSNFLILKAGQKVVSLGSNVPFDNLRNTIEYLKPTHLLCFLVRHQDAHEVNSFVQSLKKFMGKATLCLAGSKKASGNINLSSQVVALHSVKDLEEMLQK